MDLLRFVMFERLDWFSLNSLQENWPSSSLRLSDYPGLLNYCIFGREGYFLELFTVGQFLIDFFINTQERFHSPLFFFQQHFPPQKPFLQKWFYIPSQLLYFGPLFQISLPMFFSIHMRIVCFGGKQGPELFFFSGGSYSEVVLTPHSLDDRLDQLGRNFHFFTPPTTFIVDKAPGKIEAPHQTRSLKLKK